MEDFRDLRIKQLESELSHAKQKYHARLKMLQEFALFSLVLSLSSLFISIFSLLIVI